MLTFNLHIGDFCKKTLHLSDEERGMYLSMLFRYYDLESPLPEDLTAVQRLFNARSTERQQMLNGILSEFFSLRADGWHNKRADEEIEKYLAKSGKAKTSAEMRWQCERNAKAMRTHSERNSKAMLTINQEPLTKNHIKPFGADAPAKAKGTRLSNNWVLTKSWGDWAIDKGLTRERVLIESELFKNYWIAKSGAGATKTNWEATWHNWVIKAVAQGGGKSSAKSSQGFIERHTDKAWREGLENPSTNEGNV